MVPFGTLDPVQESRTWLCSALATVQRAVEMLRAPSSDKAHFSVVLQRLLPAMLSTWELGRARHVTQSLAEMRPVVRFLSGPVTETGVVRECGCLANECETGGEHMAFPPPWWFLVGVMVLWGDQETSSTLVWGGVCIWWELLIPLMESKGQHPNSLVKLSNFCFLSDQVIS